MPSAQKPALLLIDDDPISLEILSMTLTIYGHAVQTAESGNQALALLSTPPQPDAILMDTQMPGLSGESLVHALRAVTSARILAISASPIPDSLAALTDGFLLKPFTPDQLDAALDVALAPPPAPPQPAPPQPEQDPLIDPATLAKLRAMMKPAALRQLFQAVADDLGPRLTTLQAAIIANNPAEVSRIAHAIKGGCAMVGLTRIRNTAAALEAGVPRETWLAHLAQLHSNLHELNDILMIESPEQI
jgi:CheY-like chemotaxis protein